MNYCNFTYLSKTKNIHNLNKGGTIKVTITINKKIL